MGIRSARIQNLRYYKVAIALSMICLSSHVQRFRPSHHWDCYAGLHGRLVTQEKQLFQAHWTPTSHWPEKTLWCIIKHLQKCLCHHYESYGNWSESYGVKFHDTYCLQIPFLFYLVQKEIAVCDQVRRLLHGGYSYMYIELILYAGNYYYRPDVSIWDYITK